MPGDYPSNMGDEHSLERIDQLVCGALSGAAYRETLQWLDANPQYWRDCALAFLQEQAIQQELQSLVARSSDSVPTTKRNGQLRAMQLEVTTPTRSKGISERARFATVSNFVGLAALLLLSFSIGWIASRPGDGDSLGTTNDLNQATRDSSQLASKGWENVANSQREIDRVVSRNDTVSAWDSVAAYQQHSSQRGLVDAGQGGTRTVGTGRGAQDSWAISDSKFRNNLDLAGNLLKRLLPIDQEIPKELLELERLGKVRIESSSSLMPIDQENGTVLVPVQQFQIVPVVYSY